MFTSLIKFNTKVTIRVRVRIYHTIFFFFWVSVSVQEKIIQDQQKKAKLLVLK